MTRRERKYLSFRGTIGAVALALWPATAPAQNVDTVECQNGQVLTGMYAGVIVNGGNCTLDGAKVFGSVLVESGGSLTATGDTTIFGSVQVKSGRNIEMTNTEVMGEVKLEQSKELIIGGISTLATISMKESGGVTIGKDASAGEVIMEDSGKLEVSGEVAAILSTNSGDITLNNGARVFPGGVAMFSSNRKSRVLGICGSEIGLNSDTMTDGSGGVNVKGKVTVLAVADGSCPPSQIEGSVIVETGEGDVRFVGATLAAGDFVVIERTGDVELNRTLVSDVKIEKSKGNIALENVTTDSDTTIKENIGIVTIADSTLGSDVEINQNGDVTMTGNSFSLEDVLISKNGMVTIDGNCDMSLSVSENSGKVAITNNTSMANPRCTGDFGFTDANVSKNTGGVDISGNTGESLVCSDNRPAPMGKKTNEILFTDGQCKGF